MANIKINELPLYTGNTAGVSLIINDSTETTTYKVYKEKLNEGLISGSSQIVYSGLTGIPSGIISGSQQLPSGVISGSSQVDHNATTNFVANKHIDHTSVTISGTTGLSGGGDITTSRNISLDTTSITFTDGVKAKMNTENVVSGALQITNLGFATTGSQTINGSQTVNGNLVVTGSITANSYVVSSSVYYVTESFSSGSSNSGNSLDDYHNFTGSVNITGSLNVTGPIGARLYQLSDVNDNITGSVDGYLLTYNSVANNWYANPGAGLKGNVRLFVSAGRSNSTAFFFNSITRTADASPSPLADSAFMITTALLSKVSVFLRQDGNSSNSCRVDIFKNANGSAFSNATTVANSTQTLSLDTVSAYVFSGLTLNQYDAVHIKVTPGTGGSNQYYGIVVIE